MENFIVSARKYRPVTFDTVVGQQSITNTLKNAIRNNQLAQAFLFCGPRGVGKTTCARILAKTINCENPTERIEPCNACVSCKTFNESSSFNIHELDAASNNSVDDIRNLVDQVRIPPQTGKYKVYIIDEVHQLSQSAFNAFLKTLEEPPSYAKFILATTEKHKIIPTILSRCQIFDFKRITVLDIASHLEYVAKQEQVEANSEALHIIAQKADGALRDALSLFDQMVNLGDRTISRKLVIENLNVLDYDYYFRITDYLLEGNYRDSLLVLNEILENGFEGQHFIIGLGEHLRNLLMCKDPSTNKLIETSDAVRARYVKQAEKSPVFFLINCLEINNKCDITYRTSNHKRLSLEISLIQMCQAGNPVPAENTAPRVQHTKTAPETSVPQSPASVNPPAVDKIQPAQSQEADQISSKSEVQQAAEPEITPSVDSEKEILVETHKPVVTQPETDPLAETEQLPKYPVSSMHSVKDILSQGAKVSTKQDENQTKIIRQDPLDSEKVVDAFNKYANSIQNDSSMLFSALTSHAPVADDNIIFITLDNTILQKELNDSWTSLLKFLTDELNNDLIEIKVEINAQPNDVKKFMTDKDKLDAMKEKNPNFAALTDQLNLELDVM